MLSKKRGSGWEGFISLLNRPSSVTTRKVLCLITGRGADGISLQELMKACSENAPQTISGTVTGVRSTATSVGLNPDDVVHRNNAGQFLAGKLLLENELPLP